MHERPRILRDEHHFTEEEGRLYTAQHISDGPIILVRRHNWQEILSRYLHDSQVEGIKCDWEFNHCGGWVAAFVEEMTGYDYFTPFQDRKIESPGDAYLAIKAAGFDSLEEYIEHILIEKPLVYAHRGDLVMTSTPEYTGLGMSDALGIAYPPFGYFLGPNGVGTVPLLECSRCFAVGETL